MEVEKIRQNRGFTMAELLIVVAIIGVLVAVSIPVFSNQLEKAREATDAANIRSAYAQVQAGALLQDSADAFKGNSSSAIHYKVEANETNNKVNDYKASVELKQKEEGWQSGKQDIGGIVLEVDDGYSSDNLFALIVYNGNTGKTSIGWTNAHLAVD